MKRWPWVAGLTFFPFTAVLHHAVFYRPTCILNNFGPDYTLDVIKFWLSMDPAPYIGAMLAVVVYAVGRQFQWARAATVAFLIATIPLTLWIWDIPFTHRAICLTAHDGRSPLRSAYFYVLAAFAFGPLIYWMRRK